MASNIHIALASRNAALDNAFNLANNGTLVVYSGTQPANADTALSGNTALATFTLGATAFGAAAGASGATSTKTLNSVSAVAASATGTATWYRIYRSDGITVVSDGSVGTASSDLNLNTISIQISGTVSITSLQFTLAV